MLVSKRKKNLKEKRKRNVHKTLSSCVGVCLYIKFSRIYMDMLLIKMQIDQKRKKCKGKGNRRSFPAVFNAVLLRAIYQEFS